jgi:hypothetical protein
MKKNKRNKQNSNFRRTVLSTAISLCLPLSIQAVNFNVSNALDNGTGLVAGTLSHAIYQANITAGNDVIILNTDVFLTGVMKRLPNSNMIIQSDGIRRTIDGDNQFRPIFIKSGQVTIHELDIDNGTARGGSGYTAGAGMGGAIFVYDGNVIMDDINITNSKAYAGSRNIYSSGGGGMYGSSFGFASGGGGLFASTSNNIGGYDGYGNYRNLDPNFGQGGSYLYSSLGLGGGGCSGCNGGFGGGSGAYNPDLGAFSFSGFGGGSGYIGYEGYGGNHFNAAGMGGAVFIRSGTVDIQNSSMSNNIASATGEAKGLGGALFIVHSTTNSNGNNQGMPSSLASVTSCNNTFTGNTATGDTGANNNNDDFFDLADRMILEIECPIFKNGFE